MMTAVARALHLLSFAATYRNDRDQALTLANQAHAIYRDLGNPPPLADIINRLGIEEHNQGNYTRAAALYEEAQAIWRELGCTWEVVCVTTNLGVTAQAQGDISRAAAQYRESLVLLESVGETWMIEELLALVAALAAETDDRERSVRLIGATDRLLEAIGFSLAPFVHVFYERARSRVRRELGDDLFAAGWEAGQRLTREQARGEAYDVASTLARVPVRQRGDGHWVGCGPDIPRDGMCCGSSPRGTPTMRSPTRSSSVCRRSNVTSQISSASSSSPPGPRSPPTLIRTGSSDGATGPV